MVGFETPRSRVASPTVAGAAAESLDDVAADRMSECLEHIVSHVSHFANYIVLRGRQLELGGSDAGARSWDPGGMGGRARRAARRGEGAHPPRRRAHEEAAGAPLGRRSRRTTASRPIDGTKSLADLFDGRSQLLIYHFMFGPEWTAGCPVCSSIADSIAPQVPHLNARDTTAMFSSRAPAREAPGLPEADGLGNRLGLEPRPTSTATSASTPPGRSSSRSWRAARSPSTVTLNAEMCGTDAAGYVAEGPGISVYTLDDGTVYRTYVTTRRGLDAAMGYYVPAGPDPGRARTSHRTNRSGSAATTSTRRARRPERRRGRPGSATPRRAGPGRRAWTDPGRSACEARRPSPRR